MGKMKQTPADLAELDRITKSTEEKIRSYVQRLENQTERVDEEKAALKAILEEADSEGFNAALLKQVVAEKKRVPSDIRQEELELGLYRKAVGIDLTARDDE